MTRQTVRLFNKSAPQAREVHISEETLTAQLAERIMGWKSAPDRFLKSGRSWIPRWRFRPFEELEDAFQLLDRAGGCFRFARDRGSAFTAEVQIGGRRGKASGALGARTITTAVALALGLEV